jgi:hypothetical protein
MLLLNKGFSAKKISKSSCEFIVNSLSSSGITCFISDSNIFLISLFPFCIEFIKLELQYLSKSLK